MNVASPMIGCKYFVVNAFIVLNDEIGGETNPDPIAMGYSVLSLVMLFVFRCGKVRQPLLQSFGHNLFRTLADRADLVPRRRARAAVAKDGYHLARGETALFESLFKAAFFRFAHPGLRPC